MTTGINKPLVAIIGRPNVGKSTLFNRLTGSRRSIVGDEPGITRDRIYGEVSWKAKTFELVDTGGIVPDDEAIIPANIFKQAGFAIDKAQAIIWVVDARAGVTPLDEEISVYLRNIGKPVFIAANKAETRKVEEEAAEFYQFGFELSPLSAEHGTSVGDLLDNVFDALEFDEEVEEEESDDIKLAIIGRPNVGKSSLLNTILGEERVIVSPIAGTTRDSIDTDLEIDGQKFTIIATAGIRRKEKGTNTIYEFERELRRHMKFLDWAPMVTISALSGQRVTKILPLAVKANEARNKRVATSQLNKFFEENISQPRGGTAPSTNKGNVSRLKVQYITQGGLRPPLFVLFTSGGTKAGLHFSYLRYIENRLREEFEFFATPLRLKEKHKVRKAKASG